MSVALLKPHPRNPRTIRPERLEQLKRNLEADREMLQARPLIALPDGTVIAGNMRLRAAQELGWETIPVVTVDLDEDRAALWALRDNRPFGEDDETLTAEILRDLAGRGVDLDLSGFARGDLDDLLKATSGREGQTDPDDAPPAPAEPRSVRGEVYELGDHRLVCGDATDPAALEAALAGGKANAVWTDPPYGVDVEGRTAKRLKISNDTRDIPNLRRLLSEAFHAAAACSLPGSAWYVAAPMGPQLVAFTDPLLELGIWRQTIVWVKDVLVMGRSDYHYRHEAVLYGAVGDVETLAPPELAYADDSAEALLYGWMPGAAHVPPPNRKQDTVWVIPRPSRSSDHPTKKPVALVGRALRNSTRRGAIVLDPFAGSGTTAIACEQLGRRAALVELDPAYCDVIRQRYADFTGHPELAP